jgi:NitT/TauT family transport system ATP-binding protein
LKQEVRGPGAKTNAGRSGEINMLMQGRAPVVQFDSGSLPNANAQALAAQPLLDVSGVTLQYKTKEYLVTATYRVSFHVRKSDRYILLGPSGCGKSTLLKAVGGFIAPTEGTISLNGAPVTGPEPDRMMVFQEFDQLLPWKTVLQNVAFTLIKSGVLNAKEAEKKALHYVDKVNLTKFKDTYPHMLSGGMKQRVAIARAMAMEPQILLMDEPFAALDALTRRKMQDELLRLWDETRFTVLFVTHSIHEAITIGNRILLLSPHPGQVKAALNSRGADEVDPVSGQRLSDKISRLLFMSDEQDEGGAFHE